MCVINFLFLSEQPQEMDEVMHICIKIKTCYLLCRALPTPQSTAQLKAQPSHTKESTSSFSHSHITPVPASLVTNEEGMPFIFTFSLSLYQRHVVFKGEVFTTCWNSDPAHSCGCTAQAWQLKPQAAGLESEDLLCFPLGSIFPSECTYREKFACTDIKRVQPITITHQVQPLIWHR